MVSPAGNTELGHYDLEHTTHVNKKIRPPQPVSNESVKCHQFAITFTYTQKRSGRCLPSGLGARFGVLVRGRLRSCVLRGGASAAAPSPAPPILIRVVGRGPLSLSSQKCCNLTQRLKDSDTIDGHSFVPLCCNRTVPTRPCLSLSTGFCPPITRSYSVVRCMYHIGPICNNR